MTHFHDTNTFNEVRRRILIIKLNRIALVMPKATSVSNKCGAIRGSYKGPFIEQKLKCKRWRPHINTRYVGRKSVQKWETKGEGGSFMGAKWTFKLL